MIYRKQITQFTIRNNPKTERVSFWMLSTPKMLSFFSGSGGTPGPDLPSPFGRKFLFQLWVRCNLQIKNGSIDRSRSYSYFKTKFRIFQDVGGHRSGLQLQSLRPEETLQASVTSGINTSYFSSTARGHQKVDCSAQHQWHQCSWRASRLTASTDSSCFDEAFSFKTRKTKYGSGVTGWLISSLSHR